MDQMNHHQDQDQDLLSTKTVINVKELTKKSQKNNRTHLLLKTNPESQSKQEQEQQTEQPPTPESESESDSDIEMVNPNNLKELSLNKPNPFNGNPAYLEQFIMDCEL